jgi:hypothetical protein
MKQYSAMTGRLAVNFFALPFCRYRLLLVTIIGLLLPGMKGSAQTRRYVDSANTSGTYNGVAWATAYNKLETAITAAAAGDTIWVAQGTYQPSAYTSYVLKNGVAIYGGFANTDTSFHQRGWTTRKTILKGNNARVFYNYFSSGAQLLASAVLDGFTITNGTTNSYGGGMYNYYASPTLSNIIFLNNSCTASGFAVGGAIYNVNATSSYTNITFDGNKAVSTGGQSQGGAIFNSGSTLTMTNVVFLGNRSESGSGSGCYSMGGALYNASSTVITFNKVVFSRNGCICLNPQARTYGGAIYNSGAVATPHLFTNVVFNENFSTWGSVFYNEPGSRNTMVNTTFTNNTGTPNYYTIYETSSTLKLANCIFYKTPSVLASSPVAYTAHNCYSTYSLTGTTAASGNIISSVSPFMNPNNAEGADGSWLTADDGLRLKNGLNAATSPLNNGRVIDTATYTATVATDAVVDILGVARPLGAAYDMGAYEGGFDKVTRFYVDSANINGTQDGLSWATAFNKLQDVNNVAGADDTVWVAKGTYQPAAGASFSIPNGAAVYGGFPNTATAFSQRNRTLHKTILIGNGNSVVRNDLTGKLALTNSSVLDGFIITGGAAVNGGGIYNSYASPLINNIVFQANTATAGGGGIFNTNTSSPLVFNCVFQGNTAGGNGGGISNNAGSAPVIVHVTFNANTAADGGGIYNNDASPQTINTIFWRNTGVTPDIKNVGGTPSTTYSYLQSAVPDNTSILALTSPFVNDTLPAGPDGIWLTADDGLRLLYGYSSSLVNKGKTFKTNNDPANYVSLSSTDIMGTSRNTGKGYDMGAYEYIPVITSRYYVDSNHVTGKKDGLSWSTAYDKLEDALTEDGLAAGDTIWVAKGIYSPEPGKFYTLKNGVAVYGGFRNTDNAFSQRDWVNNKVILKGNNRSVFVNRFAAGSPLTNTAVLDGFTITGGRDSSGGGMNNIYASPTLNNLIFYADTAWVYGGGGMANSSSNPILNNVQFIENAGQIWGGAMYNSMSSPVLNNVLILRNKGLISYSDGDGMYSWNSSPVLNNVVFDGNIANDEGGGMYVQNETSFPVLTNVVFYGNSAKTGGGLYSTGILRMKNTTFSKNTADFGGGAYLPSSVSPPTPLANYNKISNCIFWGNTATNAASADKGSNLTSLFKYCYLQSMPMNSDSATNIRGSISPFVNDSLPRGADGIWLTEDDGLQLAFCSPAINAGINDSAATIATDIMGRARIKNGTVDIGAYEKQSVTSAGQFNGNAALSNGSSNGLSFNATCDDNGWTYYADPSKPDSLGFAINWGTGNATAKAAAKIYLKVDDSLTGAHTATSGIWTMRRYWNVDLNGTALAAPVQIRFYYNPADTLALYDSMNASGVNGPRGKIEWFKTNGVAFSPSLVTASNINGGNKTVLLPVYGADNNVAYVEFNNITTFSGGTAAITVGGAVPLPVKLLSFNAVPGIDDRSVNTSWQVASEQLDRYEVERSTDAVQFETAGTVSASGNSSYRLTDVLPTQLQHRDLFYRLKQVDAGGSYVYSKVVPVHFAGMKFALTIAPNPAKNEVILSNTNKALNGTQATVTDVVGGMVHQFMITDRVLLDISRWKSGIYLIRTENGQVQKLVKE